MPFDEGAAWLHAAHNNPLMPFVRAGRDRLVNSDVIHEERIFVGARPADPAELAEYEAAWAALDGRDYVIPDDVQRLARPVLAHRLLPTAEAIVERHLPEHVVDRIVAQLPLPRR